MIRKTCGWMTMMAITGLMVIATEARADHLEAPTGVTCDVVDDTIAADWDDVDGAVKYSVDVVVAYDTDGDGEPDEEAILEFSFGTSDRTDGGEIGDSDLTIALADLTVGVDTDGDGVEDTFFDPVAAMLKVKALDPGRDKGPQRHPFSEWCVIEL
jgi:hypothetical protein